MTHWPAPYTPEGRVLALVRRLAFRKYDAAHALNLVVVAVLSFQREIVQELIYRDGGQPHDVATLAALDQIIKYNEVPEPCS